MQSKQCDMLSKFGESEKPTEQQKLDLKREFMMESELFKKQMEQKMEFLQ